MLLNICKSYLLLQSLNQYSIRSAKKNSVTALPSRTLSFSNTFFPYGINEWNKLNESLKNPDSIYELKNYLTKLIKVKESSTFSISDPLDLKLLTRFNLFHLNEHKFRHNFRDNVTFMCCCSGGAKTKDHYLLRCQNFAFLRSNFLNRILKLMLNSEIWMIYKHDIFTAIWFWKTNLCYQH